MFITFEGIDFSGKTTQTLLLANFLQKNGYKVITIREPGGTPFAENLREILLAKSTNIDSLSELFLFEAARADLVSKVIKPALDKDYVVLCDRFYDSSVAYQGYGRGLPIQFISECNYYATKGLVPDLTFLLDIDINVLTLRSGKFEKDRFETSGIAFLQKVIDGFREIASQNTNRFYVIDGRKDIESISKEIFDIVIKKLGERNDLRR